MRQEAPDRGDAVWIDFDLQAGHEQAGRRPALILSPYRYNARTGLALLCPMTSHTKGYSFEVSIPDGHAVRGVILADQVKNLDWRIRDAEKICAMPVEVVEEVIAKLVTLLD